MTVTLVWRRKLFMNREFIPTESHINNETSSYGGFSWLWLGSSSLWQLEGPLACCALRLGSVLLLCQTHRQVPFQVQTPPRSRRAGQYVQTWKFHPVYCQPAFSTTSTVCTSSYLFANACRLLWFVGSGKLATETLTRQQKVVTFGASRVGLVTYRWVWRSVSNSASISRVMVLLFAAVKISCRTAWTPAY